LLSPTSKDGFVLLEIVSIPLRGKGKRKAEALLERIREEEGFQSPCGEKVSGKLNLVMVGRRFENVSIPLRGKGKRKG